MDNKQVKRNKLVRTSVAKWRNTETDLLKQMAELLPFPADVRAAMNKPTILRLSNTFIYLKQLEGEFSTPDSWEGTKTFVDAFGGFFITLDSSGLILQMSPRVHEILGYHSHEMIGFNILDYLHPDDQDKFFKKIRPQSVTDPCVTVDFLVRLKYKIVAKVNKTKQTGYTGMQIRGCLKKISSTQRDSLWVLIGAFYPLCVVPCVTIKTYEMSFVIKMERDRHIVDFGDKEQLMKYMGIDPKKSINKQTAMIAKNHLPYMATSMKLLLERGSVDQVMTFVTRSGNLIHMHNRLMAVFGPKGDVNFVIGHWFALSKERFDQQLGWPEEKLVRICPDFFGVPGEEGINTGALLDATFNLDNILSMMTDSPRYLFQTAFSNSRIKHPCKIDPIFQKTDQKTNYIAGSENLNARTQNTGMNSMGVGSISTKVQKMSKDDNVPSLSSDHPDMDSPKSIHVSDDSFVQGQIQDSNELETAFDVEDGIDIFDAVKEILSDDIWDNMSPDTSSMPFDSGYSDSTLNHPRDCSFSLQNPAETTYSPEQSWDSSASLQSSELSDALDNGIYHELPSSPAKDAYTDPPNIADNEQIDDQSDQSHDLTDLPPALLDFITNATISSSTPNPFFPKCFSTQRDIIESQESGLVLTDLLLDDTI